MTKNPIHRISISVRAYELDSYGHVNNAVYLQYYEQARWECIKDHGLLAKINQHELFLVVVDTHIRYMRESVLFDKLRIETRYKEERPYVVFQQKIINEETLVPVSRATIKTVFVDRQRIPQDIPTFFIS